MTHGSLFSGIGGFDLAAEWMGWENKFHCEWNEFGQKVLKYHFPKSISYGDITKTDFAIHRGEIDIITGGFPCQPYSQAGKRKGKEDDRHLWPEMLRAIREIQPRWVVGENVSGLLNWSRGMVLDEIKADLEAAGFEVFPPLVLPACAVNAPHRRDRVWIVAHTKNIDNREQGRKVDTGGQNECRRETKVRDEFTGHGKDENAPDSNSNGQYRSNSEHEINASEGGKYALNDIKPVVIANPNNTGNSSPQSRINRNGEKENEGWEKQPFIEPNGFCGDATNTNGTGWEELNDATITDNQEGISGSNDALYANGTIKQGKHIGQEGQGEFDRPNSGDGISRWENFPTKSPICSRDDGLSYGLDGITFPKWRNESIKAYGNAIVPQVAYEIFKTIEQFEIKNT